jgi:hypothetical protein
MCFIKHTYTPAVFELRAFVPAADAMNPAPSGGSQFNCRCTYVCTANNCLHYKQEKKSCRNLKKISFLKRGCPGWGANPGPLDYIYFLICTTLPLRHSGSPTKEVVSKLTVPKLGVA